MSTYQERYDEKKAAIALLNIGNATPLSKAVAYSFEPAFLREVGAYQQGEFLYVPTQLAARGYTKSSELRMRQGREGVWVVYVCFEGKFHPVMDGDVETIQHRILTALKMCREGTWVQEVWGVEIAAIKDVSAAYRDAVEYADTLHRRQEAQEANPTMGTTSYDALLDDIASAEARASELELYFYGLGLNKEGK